MNTVLAGRIQNRVRFVVPGDVLVPHAVALVPLAGQHRAEQIDVAAFPRPIADEDGIIGILLERVVLAGDVGLGGDQVVVDKQLPRAGQIRGKFPGGHTLPA